MAGRNATAKPPCHARIDRELGARGRARREALRLSQTWLGAQLGVSFQQVQKYERGANRVSASALLTIAGALSTAPAALLAGLGGADDSADPALAWATGPQGERAFVALHGLSAPAFDAVIRTAEAIHLHGQAAAKAQGRAA